LRSSLNQSAFVATAHVTGSDPKNSTVTLHIDRTLKGRAATADWVLNMKTLSPMKVLWRHFAPGAPVMVFCNAYALVTYVNRFFFFSYGDAAKGDWGAAHMDNNSNQTFNGTVAELAEICEQSLEGRRRPPALCPDLPRIDADALRGLPDWDQEVSDPRLPAPFRKGVPIVIPPRKPDTPGPTAPGLEYALYLGSKAEYSDETPVETGVTPAPDSRPERKGAEIAVRFHGYLEVPKDGDYAFVMGPDPAGHLSVALGSMEVDLSEPLLDYVPLMAGTHEVTLWYRGQGGERKFELFWTGPSLSKQPVPVKAWSHAR
jgi:hypothetical protein